MSQAILKSLLLFQVSGSIPRKLVGTRRVRNNLLRLLVTQLSGVWSLVLVIHARAGGKGSSSPSTSVGYNIKLCYFLICCPPFGATELFGSKLYRP